MIPSSDLFDQSVMSALLTHDPVVVHYRAFFSFFDWSLVEQWQQQRSPRGRHGHPISAYLKAFLIRINEGFSYTTQLRQFLIKHPLLVIELGFQLELEKSMPYGFSPKKTFPVAFGSVSNCATWIAVCCKPSCKRQWPLLGRKSQAWVRPSLSM